MVLTCLWLEVGGVLPVASQKMLGTWDPSSALFLLLEEAGEAGLGPWTMKPFPSACPNCLVFAAEKL